MKLRSTEKRRMVDEGGFSIVELLVAVVILVFVSIALMQTAIVNIEFNMKNAVRDEGVRLAGESLDDMRNAPFANLLTLYNAAPVDVERRVRNVPFKYAVTNTATDITANNKRLSTFVSWQWKGEFFNTTVSTVR